MTYIDNPMHMPYTGKVQMMIFISPPGEFQMKVGTITIEVDPFVVDEATLQSIVTKTVIRVSRQITDSYTNQKEFN